MQSIDKIKAHIQKNRGKYGFGAGITIAGITCLIMRSTTAQRGVGVGLNAQRGLANTASLSFLFKSPQTINVIKVVQRHGPGHPGYPVVNLETGLTTTSARSMSQMLNINEGVLSGHLNGKFSDVNGLHFAWADLPQ